MKVGQWLVGLSVLALLGAAGWRGAQEWHVGGGAGDPVDGGASFYSDGSAVFDGTIDAAGFLVDGEPLDIEIEAGDITREMLEDGAATSVIGRSAGTSGAVDDISTTTDGHVLRRTSGTLGFSALGTMADQNAASVGITGGTINGVTIGSGTPGSGVFTTLNASGNISSTAGRIWVGTDNASYDLNVQRNAAGTLRGRITNTGTTSSDHALWNISTATGGGNPFVIYGRGSTSWIAGIDGSASDEFAISSTFDFSQKRLRISTGGGVTVSSAAVASAAPAIWLAETDTTNLDARIDVSGGSFRILRVSDADSPLATPFNINMSTSNVTLAGDASIQGGDLDVGVSGTTRGVTKIYRGTSTNTPGAVLLEALDGTDYYVWAAADGTLRRHTSLPAADSDGSAVAGSAITPAYGSMQQASKIAAVTDEDIWTTVTGFTAGVTDGSVVTIASSVVTVGATGNYEVMLSSRVSGGQVGISVNDGDPTAATGHLSSDGMSSVIMALSATNTLRVKVMNPTSDTDVTLAQTYITVKRLG